MYDILGCILLALALYYNTLSAGFAYDDSRAILKNQDLLPETPLSQIFFDDFWGTPLNYEGSHKSYRPLCVATFRLNYALGELNPFGYHLVNVLLHAVATALVTYVARVLFKRRFPTVLTGLLFASHPIHTEAVAGIVGRADVGACVLSLSSFLCYRKYCKFRDEKSTNSSGDTKSSKRLSKWLFLLASCLCTTLSMLTKEQGITVLAINVTFDMFVQYHLRLSNLFEIYKKQYRSLQAGIVSQLLCGGVLISFRIIFMARKLPEFPDTDNPAANSNHLLTRILTFSYLPAFNLWMLLWPHILSFDWSMEAIPLIVSFADTRNLATVAFYGGLAAIGYYCVKELDALYGVKSASNMTSKVNAKHLTSSSSNKMGDHHHALSNSTGSSNKNEHNRQESLRKRLTLKNHQHQNDINFHESYNEHYKANRNIRHLNIIIISLAFMIFPFIPATNIFFYVGFVVAERILYIPSVGFCMLVATAIDQIYRKLTKSGKCIVLVMVIVQLLMYSSRTVLRNWDWHSEETLYRSGSSVNPVKAWTNLGNIFKSQGKAMEAEDAYRKALSYSDKTANAHNNLGILLQEDNRYNEAITSFEMAIKCRPSMSIAHSNLGFAYMKVGRHREAEAVLRHGATLQFSGNEDQTRGVISSLFYLGKLMHEQSRYQESLQVFLEARELEWRPDHYASLYSMLGETYFQLGKLVEAESYYKESMKVKPDYVPVHLSYAGMLSKTNRFTEGERLLKRAIELEPTNSAIYRHYGYCYSNQGKHKEAASMFKRALTHHHNDYELTANLADALRQNQDGKQAEMYYKKAVQIQPHNAGGHMNLGAMQHINNKLKEAESSYLEALRLKPDDPTTMQNLKNLRKLLANSR